jgi:TATA-box binding protein (TBP) (component of TFIID and TFIIIB)
MKSRIVHQWRDWLLEKIADGEYELTQKNTLAVQTIVASDDMDAENQCQQIIRDSKVEDVTYS